LAQPNDSSVGIVELVQSDSLAKVWSPIKRFISDKRIVALGENLHGVKEYNACKVELVKYLHEELGFNVLAVESDIAMDYFGSIYREKIPDTLLLKEMFSPIWHTNEYLELISYIKANPSLKVVGFDMLEKKLISQIGAAYNIGIDSSAESRFFFDSYQNWDEINGRERVSMGRRDSTMANILEWIIDELYPHERIIISAHNNHIANTQVQNACMGQILKGKYGSNYYSIGFFHSLGNPKHVYRKMTYENDVSQLPENSLQYQFLKLKGEKVFMDLQSERLGDSNNWMNSTFDNVLLVNKYQYKLNLSNSFDAVLWLKSVTYPTFVIDNKSLEKY
jgi:erythromycin esterase-like protein